MNVLAGRMVALSISDAPDRARLGFPCREIDRALFTLCTALIRAGARIQYAGDLRPGGWTFKLFRHLAAAYAGQHEAPFVHIVPEPVLRKTSFETLVEAARESKGTSEAHFIVGGRIRPTLPHDGGLLVEPLGEREWLPDGDALANWLDHFPEEPRAQAFSLARSLATQSADARVSMGGKMGLIGLDGDTYEGAMPGIAEEAIMTLKAGAAFVPLGAFGGSTRDVAIALGLMPKSARVPRGPQAETYSAAMKCVADLRSAIPTGLRKRLTAVALCDRAEWIALEAVDVIASWQQGGRN